MPINVTHTWSMPIVGEYPNKDICIYSALGGAQCVFNASVLWDVQGLEYSRQSVNMRVLNWWPST